MTRPADRGLRAEATTAPELHRLAREPDQRRDLTHREERSQAVKKILLHRGSRQVLSNPIDTDRVTPRRVITVAVAIAAFGIPECDGSSVLARHDDDVTVGDSLAHGPELSGKVVDRPSWFAGRRFTDKVFYVIPRDSAR